MMLGYTTYFGQWKVSRGDVNRAFQYACVACIGLLLSYWLLGEECVLIAAGLRRQS